MNKRVKMINNYKCIFWDFDGVIKESVNIKTEAFKKLFSFSNDQIILKISNHHLEHSGLSRFEKIPLYMKWTNEKISENNITKYIKKFADIVKSEVVNSSWVLGVEEYLRENKYDQTFYIITGTPEEEIKEILILLRLNNTFTHVSGSPKKKGHAIKEIIRTHNLKFENCIMIGDSLEDLKAADDNNISFLLREHSLNKDYFKNYNGRKVHNFLNICA